MTVIGKLKTDYLHPIDQSWEVHLVIFESGGDRPG